MKEPHYGLVCFKSVKTLGGSPYSVVKKASTFCLGPFSQLRMESSTGFILYRKQQGLSMLHQTTIVSWFKSLFFLLFLMFSTTSNSGSNASNLFWAYKVHNVLIIFQAVPTLSSSNFTANTKHLHNICTTSVQRPRRCSTLYKFYTNVLCLLGCVLLSVMYCWKLYAINLAWSLGILRASSSDLIVKQMLSMWSASIFIINTYAISTSKIYQPDISAIWSSMNISANFLTSLLYISLMLAASSITTRYHLPIVLAI